MGIATSPKAFDNLSTPDEGTEVNWHHNARVKITV